jgi:Co/Zn/Cd efflux system component
MLIFNLSFTVVEFLFGLWANSLSLITDSAHMLFDSASLAIGCNFINLFFNNHVYNFICL